MANYIKSKIWDGRIIKPTEENTYLNRREILKKLGLSAGALMVAPQLMACNTDSKTVAIPQTDNNFTFPGMAELYPAKANASYILDRGITKEYDATHYNNFYEFISPDDRNIYNAYKYTNAFDTRDWKIEVGGLAAKTGTHDLHDLIKRFPLEERTYRFRCVERWSMAVPWTGFSLATLIKYLEPSSKATHVAMTTFADKEQMPGIKGQPWYPWPYFEGLKMDEAMNELAFIATGIYGKPLPKQNGAPLRLVVPWKYGYKNIKSIVKIDFVNKEPGTFWNRISASEYPFISNVNPEKPHPRWSQAYERMIPDGEPIPTLKFNGYGDFVASLYD